MSEPFYIAYLPFSMTALAEWCACVIPVFYIRRRFGKGVTALLCAAGLGINYLVMVAAFQFEQLLQGSWYFRMVPLVLYTFLFLRLLLDMSWRNTVFIWVKAFLSAELMASGAWGIYCRFVLYTGRESLPVRTGIIVPIYGLVLLATFLLERSDAEYFNRKNTGHRQNLIAVILGILMFYLSNVSMSNASAVSDWEAVRLCDMRAVFDIFGYTILYLLQKIFVEQDMVSEIASIRNTLNFQYEQYVNFREASDYIGRQCHDLKHQITVLRLQESEEEREQYLTQLEETVQDYDSWISTGNSVLDTILTQKNMYCKKHGIELNCKADGRGLSFLAVRDLCSIFGHLLDNAIEAVMKYEQTEKRVIHGEVYRKQSFLIIRFENYFEDTLVLKDQLPVTTKADKARHGYGIKSIKYAVEKYNGHLSLKKEGSWFVVTLMIPADRAE